MGVASFPQTPAPAPRSLASVRPFGLPLLRLGRGSASAGIEPAPALLPRNNLSLCSPMVAAGATGLKDGGAPPFCYAKS